MAIQKAVCSICQRYVGEVWLSGPSVAGYLRAVRRSKDFITRARGHRIEGMLMSPHNPGGRIWLELWTGETVVCRRGHVLDCSPDTLGGLSSVGQRGTEVKLPVNRPRR